MCGTRHDNDDDDDDALNGGGNVYRCSMKKLAVCYVGVFMNEST